LRCQELVALSEASWATDSGAAAKRVTQIPAAISARAAVLAVRAISRAVLPVTHPPQLNPAMSATAMLPAQHQTSAVLLT
jgi:hypothetical protein